MSAGPGPARRSLFGQLLAWALGALLLVWASMVVVAYRTGLHESDELTDGHLASVATLLLAQPASALDGLQSLPPPAQPPSHDYQQTVHLLVWDGAGQLRSRLGDAPVPAFSRDEGFATLQLGTPSQDWRSFARWTGGSQPRRVMVLISVRARQDLGLDIAAQVAGPGLWLLPIVALALGLAIRRGLRPLEALSADLRGLARPGTTASPRLATDHPEREFESVVQAINSLVQRQHDALAHERTLANELAHELRTPLAALVLQARRLRESASAGQTVAPAELQQLEADALHAGEVLAQLLALARAERAALAGQAQALDLAMLAQQVAAELGQVALDSGHELALHAPQAMPLRGHPLLLELALRNLLDNALAHSPAGTLVELQIDSRQRWLQVCDGGPPSAPLPPPVAGARPATLGLGLGHRVVARVAEAHGARLLNVPPPPGFSSCYRLQF